MFFRFVSPVALAVLLSVPAGVAYGQTAGPAGGEITSGQSSIPEMLPPMPPAGEATGGAPAPLLSDIEQEAVLREEAESREPSVGIVETVPPGPAGEATGGGVTPLLAEQQALLEDEVAIPAPDRVREPEAFRGPAGEATGGGLARY